MEYRKPDAKPQPLSKSSRKCKNALGSLSVAVGVIDNPILLYEYSSLLVYVMVNDSLCAENQARKPFMLVSNSPTAEVAPMPLQVT